MEGRALNSLVSSYFQHLFTSSYPTYLDVMLEFVILNMFDELNADILKPYSINEEQYALFHMHPLKAPVPNGLSSIFYQKYWNIIGSLVSRTALDSLNDVAIPSSLNKNYIVRRP